jgi:hypothetical protein
MALQGSSPETVLGGTHRTALKDAVGVVRGLVRGEIRLVFGAFEPSSRIDAEEIVAVTLGMIFGLTGVSERMIESVASVLAGPPDEECSGQTDPTRSLVACLRLVQWSPAMLALFRSIALHRVVARLAVSEQTTGAIRLASAAETAVGHMRGTEDRHAAFVLPARALPRPVLASPDRERIAMALADLLLRRSAAGECAARAERRTLTPSQERSR